MEGCFVEEVMGQFVFIQEDFIALNFGSSCRIHYACCTCFLEVFLTHHSWLENVLLQ